MILTECEIWIASTSRNGIWDHDIQGPSKKSSQYVSCNLSCVNALWAHSIPVHGQLSRLSWFTLGEHQDATQDLGHEHLPHQWWDPIYTASMDWICAPSLISSHLHCSALAIPLCLFSSEHWTDIGWDFYVACLFCRRDCRWLTCSMQLGSDPKLDHWLWNTQIAQLAMLYQPANCVDQTWASWPLNQFMVGVCLMKDRWDGCSEMLMAKMSIKTGNVFAASVKPTTAISWGLQSYKQGTEKVTCHQHFLRYQLVAKRDRSYHAEMWFFWARILMWYAILGQESCAQITKNYRLLSLSRHA